MATDKNAMALYVKVVENHSFSKAAQREGVPISTVSRKISDLEKELGVRLLERSTRQLRMTEIGQEYFEHCRRGLEEFEAANLLVTDRQAEVSGRLRISVPPSLSDIIVVPMIEIFRELYPQVIIHCLVTDRHVEHIADGVDLSLRVGELRDSSLVARRLLRYRSVLVASPDYINREGEPAHPRELAKHCVAAFSRWDTTVRWALQQGDDTQRLIVEPKIALNDYLGVQRAVIDGQGISEIPSIICGEGLKDGRLVEVMSDWQFEPVTIAAIYPSNRNPSRVVRLFRDFIIEKFESFAPHANTA
jgi:DNA-binding transcriptional LysR family regulator